ncbi:deoxyribodipyrimidine photo-lyase [Sebaldella sp. S0638]|uniref:deoxyribodipyrimidine photo-lyase n=1 Tax=Sebaldella sp. S0638 TaxID=2957809 RepID=UPI00209F5C08|nr:deoxyribodipyrimidine photo-lyase [Sebaldella sp. S0638]MCP1223849.1 deoxyribodipyrimidine photo-lyase [Sebaldella sp. S0638]
MFENRIKSLNNKKMDKNGEFVIYWMQRSIRSSCNHSLEYAVQIANDLKKDLLVIFCFDSKFSEMNERSCYFLFESLKDTEENLKKRGIRFIVLDSSPLITKLLEYAEKSVCVITDRGYLKYLREIREKAAEKILVRMVQVESDVVVPVETASSKEEYSAKTLRGKLHKVLEFYINREFDYIHYEMNYLGEIKTDFDLKKMYEILGKLNIDRSVKKSEYFYGGENTAKKTLETFIAEKLDGYSKYRNNPELDYQSDLSPYLHFGNISPLFIAKEILKSQKNKESTDDFLEELIVRRELAINFVYYNPDYDKFQNMTYSWAYETMEKHKNDQKDYIYSPDILEKAETHDEYWNSAQKEMMITGKMHGYMRMYWAKKIIEWSEGFDKAYEVIKYLNNKYFIDGRDENSYAGIAWCFGKHDRAWNERNIFGKIRYMNSNGLKRKFNIDMYTEKINKL